MLLNTKYLTLLLVHLVTSDLQFGKVDSIPPEIDSSAHYRSVIVPRIFGGERTDKSLKTGVGPYQRQRYYKPTSDTTDKDCSLSPYATYLTEEDQADLYILVNAARKDSVPEADIKMLMEEYARNSMSPERFAQFQQDNQRFEARLEKLRRDRVTRAVPRLFSKQMPKEIKPKNNRQLQEHLNDNQYFGTIERAKLKRHGNTLP